MEQKQPKFLATKLRNLLCRPEFWFAVIIMIVLVSIQWPSVYMVAAFTMASIFAWITYDAAYPVDEWF
jgi:hypothetical protein